MLTNKNNLILLIINSINDCMNLLADLQHDLRNLSPWDLKRENAFLKPYFKTLQEYLNTLINEIERDKNG
mgnify:CR=1 FL=1